MDEWIGTGRDDPWGSERNELDERIPSHLPLYIFGEFRSPKNLIIWRDRVHCVLCVPLGSHSKLLT